MSTVESPGATRARPAVGSGRLPYVVSVLSGLYAVLGAGWVSGPGATRSGRCRRTGTG